MLLLLLFSDFLPQLSQLLLLPALLPASFTAPVPTPSPAKLREVHSPTNSNLKLWPSHMAQLLPKLVTTVIAGVSRNLLLLDWTKKGTPVLTWPSERKGAKRPSRFAWSCGADVEATGWVRARLVGREATAVIAEGVEGRPGEVG